MHMAMRSNVILNSLFAGASKADGRFHVVCPGIFVVLVLWVTSKSATATDISECVVCSSYNNTIGNPNVNEPDCLSSDASILAKFVTKCSNLSSLVNSKSSDIGCQQTFVYRADGLSVERMFRSCADYVQFSGTYSFSLDSARSPAGVCFINKGFQNQPGCICTTGNSCNVNGGVTKYPNGTVLAGTSSTGGGGGSSDPVPTDPSGNPPGGSVGSGANANPAGNNGGASGASSDGSCTKRTWISAILPLIAFRFTYAYYRHK